MNEVRRGGSSFTVNGMKSTVSLSSCDASYDGVSSARARVSSAWIANFASKLSSVFGKQPANL